jgi:hypothetical protein
MRCLYNVAKCYCIYDVTQEQKLVWCATRPFPEELVQLHMTSCYNMKFPDSFIAKRWGIVLIKTK